MLKVAIIGLGDIAKKAYLPVLSSRKGIEFHICTRNASNLQDLSEKYRFQYSHSSIESLLKAKPDCAFVNTATDAHYEVVKALLQNGIHVYVDKPITMHYNLSKELVDLAEYKQLILMVGFNRRYAPVYKNLKELVNPSMIILQKNRTMLPDELRRFVVEDFIHVVDTMRYLFPYPIDNLLINGMKRDDLLHHLTIQFITSTGQTAIGIMNRDSGATEEKLEIMSKNEKRVVYNVSELQIQHDKNTLKVAESDWQSNLFKRGFDQMIDDFLDAVRNKTVPAITAQDALLTHRLCETIVERLSV
ncbi:MAG: gfo/Idh/MocA family oxidoreductase [Daejeonella sp.]|nr:gfo/Idh/MocA family oxidoreductase [Daejeonella sp.]